MEYIKGFTWGTDYKREFWKEEIVLKSLKLLIDCTAIDTIALPLIALQETPHQTKIMYEGVFFPTDEEIDVVIKTAHQLGLKVILKPMVNLKDGHWRGFISFFEEDVVCEPKWSDWFKSYQHFIRKCATIAQKHEVYMFCIGCELVMTNHRENEWRDTILLTREIYKGKITYNCDKYQEHRINWWDELDVISSSGYYPIHDWDNQLSRIEQVVKKYDKPFFFMEAGCPSSTGLSTIPNDWTRIHEVNIDEQNDYYLNMFEKTNRKSWFKGFCLWDWPTIPYHIIQASIHNGYCVYGKKAQETIKRHYLYKEK